VHVYNEDPNVDFVLRLERIIQPCVPRDLRHHPEQGTGGF